MNKLLVAIAFASASSVALAGTETYFDHCLGDHVTYSTTVPATTPQAAYFDHAIGCRITANGDCAS